MECNIDQRGRQARLVTGAVVDAAGVAAIVVGLFLHEPIVIIVGAVVTVAGSFMILEGAISWCALRALGFKTKI